MCDYLNRRLGTSSDHYQHREPFPSCLCFVNLQCVDGLAELSRRGQQRSLRRMCQGLELGVGPLAGCAELRVGAVGLFLGFGLVLPPVRGPFGSETGCGFCGADSNFVVIVAGSAGMTASAGKLIRRIADSGCMHVFAERDGFTRRIPLAGTA